MRHLLMMVLNTVLSTGCHDDHDHISKLEGELHEQRQKTDQWMTVAGVLGVGCTVLFSIGVGIGAKARKRATQDE